MGENIDVRNRGELNSAIALAQHTVYKRYLPELEKYPLVAPTKVLLDESAENCLRFFQLDEFTCKKGEDIFQKLSTVYHASMSLGCNLIVLVDVEKNDAPVKIYIGVRNSGEDTSARTKLGTSFRTLKSGIRSNFPGTKLHDVPSQEVMPKLVDEMFGEQTKYISSVSCVASVRDKSKTENKNFIQGLERFIDAMRGNTYTAVFIAEPMGTDEQATIRNGYESLYSSLSSFRKSTWSYNENESTAVMESLSKGISKAVSDGTSHTQAHTVSVGMNLGINSSQTNSNTVSHTESDSKTKPTKVARTGQALSGVAGVCGLVGKIVFVANPAAGRALIALNGIGSVVGGAMQGDSTSHSAADTIANTIGKTLGVSGGLNAGYAQTTSNTTSHTETDTTNDTETSGTTNTKGSGKVLQIENINKPIDEMLKRIEDRLKRVQEGEDYGSYSCGAYFLSGKQESSLLAANTYRALMIGEGSSVESGAINLWNGIDESEKVLAMKQYIRRFVHPIFAMPVSEMLNDASDFVFYTPGTVVSGLELPLHLGLPTKSVYGLPVLEHAEFGRNVTKKDAFSLDDEREIKIGKVYHMGQVENKALVELDVQGFSAHTFVTGSTGSGKSNTIYQMLNRLDEQQVHFLVIEPSKGEYKSVFGKRDDVVVYGTNPKISDTEMLHINPFSFPANVHVLEHMDRLVEIFNVCWPMYAAMPAILKDSIERAYKVAGWDLETSENKYDEHIYPMFADVLVQIRKVLEESEYSEDNKGDYTGSLATRIRSLTNGINGLIFSSDEISDEQLFDANVIVDLSRIGSTETKALIMGILILKLQEYRMESHQPNSALHHVTVLEEAHNLLRRTSLEQSSEGSNLLGKSVEMLANAIAEMRTYGEGFIIADQSPGLLDMSVIRNTNTKIILRLPDYSDRELVGKAAGLNEEQIIELAKLEKGVAAIMQSDWLEAVLCKVDKYVPKDEPSSTNQSGLPKKEIVDTVFVRESLLECIMNKEIYRKGDRVDIQMLKNLVIKSKLDTSVKCEFMDYIMSGNEDAIISLRKLIYEFFEAEKAIQASKEHREVREWANAVVEQLNPSVKGYNQHQLDLLLALIVFEKADRDLSYNALLCRFTELYKWNGGVL